jgi:transposase
MKITTIGPDLAKSVFQIHGIDTTGQVVVRKSLRRSQILPFFLPSCLLAWSASKRAAHRIIGRAS